MNTVDQDFETGVKIVECWLPSQVEKPLSAGGAARTAAGFVLSGIALETIAQRSLVPGTPLFEYAVRRTLEEHEKARLAMGLSRSFTTEDAIRERVHEAFEIGKNVALMGAFAAANGVELGNRVTKIEPTNPNLRAAQRVISQPKGRDRVVGILTRIDAAAHVEEEAGIPPLDVRYRNAQVRKFGPGFPRERTPEEAGLPNKEVNRRRLMGEQGIRLAAFAETDPEAAPAVRALLADDLDFESLGIPPPPAH